ncbi:VRR-NUC domain-containing protein [Mobiluncus curtisii]|uniref:VRR-NUC domain-containing protein n=1 Tax=Mobiluncus curtisii TaxID=2051 RepID=UPI00242B0CEB|nr:VRR-NUC domain-containing protein [Mobiluncus curtisii]
MRETLIEHQLIHAIHAHGGLCWKWIAPGTAGVPDRIAILPRNKIIFIEVKAPGQKPRPIQTYRINQLKKLGAHVYIIDSPQAIKQMLNDYQKGKLK